MRLHIVALLSVLAISAEAQPSPPLSAERALVYSAGATAGLVGVGYVLQQTLPRVPEDSDAFSPHLIGTSVIAIGLMAGPSVGNSLLGADDDVKRGWALRSTGLAVSAAVASVGVLGCTNIWGGPPNCNAEFYLGAAGVIAVGTLVGTAAYDLATIPGNAAEARARLNVAYNAEAQAPGLNLVVGL
ncbi:MAG: hypothetical protein Rubg2KO_04640 [Rubricoccaceae bacterium]